MVFNSIDEKEYGVSDGARTYMLFPRNQVPTVSDQGDLAYFKSSTKGIELILNLKNSGIVGMVGGKAVEDPKVHPHNKGGLELSNVKALVLDGGWMNYGDPLGEPRGKSTFIDPQGNKCVITNKEVFEYDNDGDNIFKFTDKELKDFLKTRCPNLKPGF